ncbi:hypothetical protein [Halorubrum sp. DM2]|uniref:hypothetical protein n=1 Tax=Halorubrum sp. DM2 TaxID=2527867 RepID=UPI0024B7F834|nr:hypothetical protein [Halorubrum sp. DM2]
MTEFLCISLITDAARFDNGEGFQSASIEYLRNRENDKVITEKVKEIGRSLLEMRDRVYRILCSEFSSAEYDLDDEDSIESTIRDVVSISTIRREITDPLPPGLGGGLEELENVLIENMDNDPFEIVSNIRRNIRSRNTDVVDYLEERVREVNPGEVDGIRTALKERIDSDIVACTCADAAGWWTPRPHSVRLTVGQKSEIESNLDIINEYFGERGGSPRGVDLIKLELQEVTQ